MRPLLNLKAGTFLMPFDVTNEDGSPNPRPQVNNAWLVKYVKLIQDMNVNLSYAVAPERKLGTMNSNGTCDGVLGTLQRGEADFTIFPNSYTAIPKALFAYTPVVYEYEHVIYSTAKAVVSEYIDVLTAFFEFDLITSFAMFMTIVSAYLFLRYLRPNEQPLTSIVEMLFRQNFIAQSIPFRVKTIVSIFAVFILFTSGIFDGVFTTDLASLDQLNKIRSLRDLATAKKVCPVFVEMYPFYKDFECPVSKTHEKIWAKTVQCGVKKHVVDIMEHEGYVKTLATGLRAETAFMAPRYWKAFMLKLSCLYYGHQVLQLFKEGGSFILSPPFMVESSAYVVSKNIKTEKKQIIDLLSFLMLESGFSFYLTSLGEYQIPMVTHSQYICGEKEYNTIYEEKQFQAINLQGWKITLGIGSLMIVIATLILILEVKRTNLTIAMVNSDTREDDEEVAASTT